MDIKGAGIGGMDRAIGVFDSGLGGLTVVRELAALLPGEDIVYFGDTGRVPYGTRSAQTIERYAREDCALLLEHDVKLIVAACGTVSSVAPQVLRGLPVPAVGVVEPAAAAAAGATSAGRIGVMATAATVRMGAYQRELARLRPGAEVTAVACPLLVQLVETGWVAADDEVTLAVTRRYLAPLMAAAVDTVILGCTHFPLLAPVIRRIMGDGVTLIDAGAEAARACVPLLAEGTAGRRGTARFYVSDSPEGFRQVAEMFLGRRLAEGELTQVRW